ncbi:MAG TPA: UbiA family prenyltransferase [Kiritimatiellia bacterium]|nr:UbiA family prenyltransferase [Kiritimatiellia bacterium]
MGSAGNRLGAWLRLVRLPNVLTVPGDVLVGFALATADRTAIPADLLAALLAGPAFYMAGLILNDLVDIERDRVERPARPLAAGIIGRGSAMQAAVVLLGVAMLLLGIRGLAPLMVGAILGGLIFLYNLRARRHRALGALVMGLCRAGNVALGVAAGAPIAFLHAETIAVLAWWAAYIGAVTWLAAREMDRGAYGRERWLPMAAVLFGGGFLLFYGEQSHPISLFRAVFSLAFAVLIIYQSGIRLAMPTRWKTVSGRIRTQEPATLYPPAIGGLVSALLPMQAAVIILMSDEAWMLLAALLMLLAWPVNRWLARKIPAS